MTDANSADSPLEAGAGTAGPRATEAFSVLGNETRLSIMLALWEAFEPFAVENAVPFSELRDCVGMRDSGQFNYHLDKLEGHFVRKTDDGYELRRAGLQLVRTVLAGAGIEHTEFERTELDLDCTNCGATTELTYQDEWLYLVCTQCEGFYDTAHDRPSGILAGGPFDPAGFLNRSPKEMWQAHRSSTFHHIQSAIEGVCDTCSGPIDSSLHICDDHGSEGMCDACGRRVAISVRFACPVCKNHHTGPPSSILAMHPAVITFYYEHGLPILYDVDDFESIRRRTELIGTHEQTLVSDNPIRVQVTVRHEDDELQVIINEDLDIVDMSRGTDFN